LTMIVEESNEEKKLLEIEPWPADEVSTRNCYHCLVFGGGLHVGCRLGHSLSTNSHKKRRLTYNGVIRMPRLLKPCLGCPDFRNDWG
jgi:hypothetical protein